MKQLVCEMCNSSELIKQDGVFICQCCGCKYSVEDAKRMMIEGNVDVSGSTVKVDNSAFVEKYLTNSRRARKKEDWEETEKYYNMVEQNDPTNIEAIFYSSYSKARQSLLDKDLYKRQAVFKAFNNSISILDDNFSTENDYNEQLSIIKEIYQDMRALCGSTFVYNLTKNGYGNVVSDDKKQTHALFVAACITYAATVQDIAGKFNGDIKGVEYYRIALEMYEFVRKVYDIEIPVLKDSLLVCHNAIKKHDSSHEIPDYDAMHSEQVKKKKSKAIVINVITFAITFTVLFFLMKWILNI